jgi:hypothetical protein
MPVARPLVTVSPPRANQAANSRAVLAPAGVGLREPTIAS